MDTRPLHELLATSRHAGVFSAAAYEVGTSCGPLAREALGTTRWGGPPIKLDTPFDIASITKPLVGVLTMLLLDRRELALDDPIRRYLPEYAATDKGEITVLQLLTHASGIPGQQPLYRTCSTSSELLDALRSLRLLFPPGRGVAYTSQGFMILGRVLEAVTTQPLHQCLPRLVLHPLGMSSTSFGLPPAARHTAAATERCPWRGHLVHGTVHDENAHVLGGCAGHAGLFSTAADLARLCRLMLNHGATGTSQLITERTALLMTTAHTDHLPLRRALAWQGRDRFGCPAGDLVSYASYGHTGFTGTSVWIDPQAGLYIILLTNAVHPRRAPERIQRLRPRFHDLAIDALGSNRKSH